MKDKNNNIEVIKNNYYNINDINDINNIEYKINNEEYIKESVYKLLTPSSYLKQPVSQQFAVIRTYARILSTKPSKINPRTTTTSIQQTNPQTIPANQQTNQNSYIDDKKVNLMKKIFDFSDCNRALLDRSLEIIELFAKCEIDLSKFLFKITPKNNPNEKTDVEAKINFFLVLLCLTILLFSIFSNSNCN